MPKKPSVPEPLFFEELEGKETTGSILKIASTINKIISYLDDSSRGECEKCVDWNETLASMDKSRPADEGRCLCGGTQSAMYLGDNAFHFPKECHQPKSEGEYGVSDNAGPAPASRPERSKEPEPWEERWDMYIDERQEDFDFGSGSLTAQEIKFFFKNTLRSERDRAVEEFAGEIEKLAASLKKEQLDKNDPDNYGACYAIGGFNDALSKVVATLAARKKV